tara:strand:- start:7 stop:660 length:654 start_codon:yes stop_codon:yes gene_type:complete
LKEISNKKEALIAVQQNGYNLEYVSDELRADKEVVIAAVQQDKFALQFASDDLKIDEEVLAITKNESFDEDIEIPESKYTIIGNIDHIGYRREGGGRVLYVFNDEIDLEATEFVVNTSYTEKYEGDLDHAEYDPSIIETSKYTIEDEQSISEVLGEDNKDKSGEFFEDMLKNYVVIIFVDNENLTIEQIEENKINALVERCPNLMLYAREYDHIYDY